MISFYPGPSRVDENIPEYVQDAYKQGILSLNHRSKAFMQICEETIDLLKSRLHIPEDYVVLFTSSATECWEIIAQSLIDVNSYHFYNGAFGKKWFDYTRKLKYQAIGYQFDPEQELKTGEMDLSSETGVICITQNETSNGTQVNIPRIAKLRKKYPDHLIAVDATSSMAGIYLDFSQADIWYASVQKCFGLPAGLAIMICSPSAIERSGKLRESRHYNSLNFILENIKKFQTPYTPNVLGIYLLMRVMENRKPIGKIEKKLRKRLRNYEAIFSESEHFSLHISNKNVRSETVIVLEGTAEDVQAIKKKAEEEEITLGNGYGELKDSTFRIANFPSLKKEEVKALQKFLKKNILQ
ncbi:aminotransferase class V-fold PLP-dependent enzyme [Fulvivirga ulvae]|uniref:aminotransferase class V-fold PLP-dependent enzyme n=1 Tax=Fulvivirga ulvae TaxID=2904245 RepID=UPI001F2E1C25|nr:aminotransferase class V-fold PLP-dependent enzyme [Fulvivirga ulvae]UII34974.1 aminotransferase class V-fold PLP-dependent enzyme [Fulvivirga ulvae]